MHVEPVETGGEDCFLSSFEILLPTVSKVYPHVLLVPEGAGATFVSLGGQDHLFAAAGT